jgi:argininosuccinate lyase
MQSLAVAAGIAKTTKFNAKQIAAALDEGYLDATSLAEYLTGKGVPFRRAHQIVGRLVARASAMDKPLAELPLNVLQRACKQIEKDVYSHLGAANVVRRYAPDGSAGPKQLRKQLAFWKRKLG